MSKLTVLAPRNLVKVSAATSSSALIAKLKKYGVRGLIAAEVIELISDYVDFEKVKEVLNKVSNDLQINKTQSLVQTSFDDKAVFAARYLQNVHYDKAEDYLDGLRMLLENPGMYQQIIATLKYWRSR